MQPLSLYSQQLSSIICSASHFMQKKSHTHRIDKRSHLFIIIGLF